MTKKKQNNFHPFPLMLVFISVPDYGRARPGMVVNHSPGIHRQKKKTMLRLLTI